MKKAHNVNLRVFSYEGEDAQKIEEKLKNLCPFDLAFEKIVLTRKTVTGFREKKIIIFEISLSKENHTSKFLKNLKNSLSEDQRALLVKQAESRLDENLNFFIRFDKDKLMDEGRICLTESGNCFHMKMNVAAYPTNRENALKVVKDWLNAASN